MEGAPQRLVWGLLQSVVHERFQRWRRAGIFEKLMRRMAQYYSRESAAESVGGGRRWIPSTVRHLWEARGRARTPPTEESQERR